MKLCLALLLLAALAVSRVKSTCSIVGGLDDPDLASDTERCEFQDKCIDLNSTKTVVVNYMCQKVTCENIDGRLTSVATNIGCSDGGKCFVENDILALDECSHKVCTLTTSEYRWTVVYTGCYLPNGTCILKGTVVTSNCLRSKCDANAMWTIVRLDSALCSPANNTCTINGVPGCDYKGKCKPVKTVLAVDGCLQYVCYSKNKKLNNGVNSVDTEPPIWIPRPTGCYSPNGCLAFGETYRDPWSRAVYRCEFNFPTVGVTYARYVSQCIAPDGTSLSLRDTLQIAAINYSCSQTGLIAFDSIKPFVTDSPDHHTCGDMYKKQDFYTPQGICRYLTYWCQKSCNYFEPICYTENDGFAYLGENWNYSNAICSCTADINVNNNAYNPNMSLWNTPILCGQTGVSAPCADPVDNSLHGWNELWKTTSDVGQPIKICTCHPITRVPYCSSYLPDVLNATSVLQVPFLSDK